MMPEIENIFSLDMLWVKTFTIGIAPATEASNPKKELDSLANLKISLPCSAISALFAVITCFLFFRDSVIISYAAVVPPINSMMIEISGSFTRSIALLVVIIL